MKELYEAIEVKIKASGYPRAISGEDVYNDICDQIDGKENGSYVLLSKFEDDVIFEYHITIQDEDFNLGILTMRPWWAGTRAEADPDNEWSSGAHP